MKKVIIGFVFVIVGVIGILFINPGNIFLPLLIKISKGPNSVVQKGTKIIPYSTLFTVLKPQPVVARTVSKRITAMAGGIIQTTDVKGTIATLYIPAGALSEDTTISMSPLQQVPIENFGAAISNGVVVEPEGLQFLKSAQLTLELKSKKAGSLNALPNKAMIIHINHKSGHVNISEATRSMYGSKLTAMVHSLSSFSMADLNGPVGGKLGQNDIQNGAADAGGACTPAFISLMLRLVSLQQAVGTSTGAAMDTIEECSKKALEEMERRCEVDTIHVTRREMFGLIQMLQQLGFQPEAARAEKLMQSCKRIYSVSAEQAAPVDQGHGTYAISAQLCGYMDEQWVGSEIVDYTLGDGKYTVHNVYTGEIHFTAPRGGGQFQMSTRGSQITTNQYLGEIVTPSEGDGQLMEYDGNKQLTVFYAMYGHADIPLTIEMTKHECESTNEALVQAGA